MRLIESSHTEVSGTSDVPWFDDKLIILEAQLLCICSKIVSIDIDRNTKYKQKTVQTDDFSKEFEKLLT